ncbi:Protein of unknown function [Gryllus bimaculatus]|nr:Protein of unknown function [Gryllus bimaculatus]
MRAHLAICAPTTRVLDAACREENRVALQFGICWSWGPVSLKSSVKIVENTRKPQEKNCIAFQKKGMQTIPRSRSFPANGPVPSIASLNTEVIETRRRSRAQTAKERVSRPPWPSSCARRLLRLLNGSLPCRAVPTMRGSSNDASGGSGELAREGCGHFGEKWNRNYVKRKYYFDQRSILCFYFVF